MTHPQNGPPLRPRFKSMGAALIPHGVLQGKNSSPRSFEPNGTGATSAGIQTSRDSPAKLRRLVSASRSLQALHRWKGGPSRTSTKSTVDTVKLVQQIAATLATEEAFERDSLAVFEMYAVDYVDTLEPGDPVSLEPGPRVLPCTSLLEVLAYWDIPQDHIPLFWTVLRNFVEDFDTGGFSAIEFDGFKAVLLKFLRRVRDRYSGFRLSKGQFVTQNRKTLEEEYGKKDLCGSGSFGQCFWVAHRVTGLERVVKVISKEEAWMPKEEIAAELNILKSLDHPNIVRLFEWFETDSSFCLVMEAAKGGDLLKALREQQDSGGSCLPETMVQKLLNQCFRALIYIHSQKVIHRDLKPANMFLADKDAEFPHLLLADFGQADIFEQSGPISLNENFAAQRKGTFSYMAPECFNEEVSPKSDVWSMGIVTFELLSGQRPFRGNPMAVYNAILKEWNDGFLEPVRLVGGSEAACDFIELLLEKMDIDRPTAEEVYREGWLHEWEGAPEYHRGSMTNGPRLSTRSHKTLIDYKHKSAFTKVIFNAAASQVDASKLGKLNDMFRKLDSDGNGRLTIAELSQGLRQQGLDADALVDSLDIDHSGEVEYTEFVAGLLANQRQLTQEVLFHVFAVFDADGDGKLSLNELRQVLKGGDTALAAVLPDGKTLEQILEEIDTSHDGLVSYEEFKRYLEAESGHASQGPMSIFTVQERNDEPDSSVCVGEPASWPLVDKRASQSLQKYHSYESTCNRQEPLEEVIIRRRATLNSIINWTTQADIAASKVAHRAAEVLAVVRRDYVDI